MTEPLQIHARPAPAAIVQVGTSKFLSAYIGQGAWLITEWDDNGTVFSIRLPPQVVAFIADPENATDLIKQAIAAAAAPEVKPNGDT